MKKSPSTPSDWEGESDAHTLASAAAIRADPKKMARAAKAAKRLAKEQEVKARAMRSVAGGKLSGKGKLPGPKRWS